MMNDNQEGEEYKHLEEGQHGKDLEMSDESESPKFDEQQITDVVNRFFSQSSDQRLKYMKGF